MKRRHLLQGSASALLPVSAHASTARTRPNIVYIHSHDSGRYLSPYKSGVPAPALARLAQQGVLFHQVFSGAPVCSPSRAAMLTGQPAHRSGMNGLAHRGFSLNDPRQLIFRYLQQYGYQAILTGMQHVAADPDTLGYDLNLCQRDAQGHWRSEAAVVAPVVERFLASRPRQPFFLDVGFFETHREYPEPQPQDIAQVRDVPRSIPDTPQTRYDFAAFGASVRQLNTGVSRVLDALNRHGYDSNTLVIFTTDHGLPFPRMKCTLTDEGLGTAFIMRGPGLAAGHESDTLISQTDLFPTLCAYLNLPQPAWLTGTSFLPCLTGHDVEIHDTIFAEVSYHAAYEPMRAVRSKRWKYIRRFDQRSTPVLPNCDDSPSKAVWLAAGWQSQQVEQEALYDLTFDPTEHNNRAHDPDCQNILQDMRRKLRAWMQQTQDPLLNGPVRAPLGAVVNRVDGISPHEPPVPA